VGEKPFKVSLPLVRPPKIRTRSPQIIPHQNLDSESVQSRGALTKEQRQAIARKAAVARWGKTK
jgi:hypothetical protein